MEENGSVSEKAEDLSTRRLINAQRGESGYHHLGLNMIEEVREVEEEDATNAVS